MISASSQNSPSFTAARNSCKLCAPLGACLAFRGVEKSVPLLHGAQGCATYIRRYMISHFKEPMDIASSNFDEAAAVYGGQKNLRQALENIIRQYQPRFVGIATTCLAETIGDDVRLYLRAIREELGDRAPELVHVSTPSYSGTHAEGFRAALLAIVESLSEPVPRHDGVNLLSGMVSPADIRYLKRILADFGLEATLLPDYSETLDAPAWAEYHVISPGGTPLESIHRMGGARATVELASAGARERTAGACLEEKFGIPCHRLPLPIGVIETDEFFEVLKNLSGCPVPAEYRDTRGRLVDAYVDAHKHVFGKRAVVYGEPDLVVGLVSLLREIGMVPALCATGSESSRLAERITEESEAWETVGRRDTETRRHRDGERSRRSAYPRLLHAGPDTVVIEGADFLEIEEAAASVGADIILGSSKGYTLARKLGVPLVRVGFPIHDRIDGPRLLHLGYHGAQQLFDRITNALIGTAQDTSPVGYSYM